MCRVGPALLVFVVDTRWVELGHYWDGTATEYAWRTPYAATASNDVTGGYDR